MEDCNIHTTRHSRVDNADQEKCSTGTTVKLQDLPEDIVREIIGHIRPGKVLRGVGLLQVEGDLHSFAQFAETCVRFSEISSKLGPEIEVIDAIYPMQLNRKAFNLDGNTRCWRFKTLLQYAAPRLKVLRLCPSHSMKDITPVLLVYANNLQELEFEDDFEDNLATASDSRNTLFSTESTLRRLHISRPQHSLKMLGPMERLESLELTDLGDGRINDVSSTLNKFGATLPYMNISFRCCSVFYNNLDERLAPIVHSILRETANFEVLETLGFGVRCSTEGCGCRYCHRAQGNCIDVLRSRIFHDLNANRQRLQQFSGDPTRLQCLRKLELTAPSRHIEACLRPFKPVLRKNVEVELETEMTTVYYTNMESSKNILYRHVTFNTFNIGFPRTLWTEILQEVKESIHLGGWNDYFVEDFSDLARSVLQEVGSLPNLEKIVFQAGSVEYLTDALMCAPHVMEIEVPFSVIFGIEAGSEQFARFFSSAKNVRILYLVLGDGDETDFLKGLGLFLRDTAAAFPKVEAICYTENPNFHHVVEGMSGVLEELRQSIASFRRDCPNVDIRSILSVFETIKAQYRHWDIWGDELDPSEFLWGENENSQNFTNYWEVFF